jgi:prepilin-type N-terminal cleavage/methylation domain-containing protein
MTMPKRPGFTLPEVLITVVVLTIALTGVISVAGVALKKSANPDKVVTAALLCNERLNYFRGQADPYRAVGGTWYKPPLDNEIDYNDSAYSNSHHNAGPSFNCNQNPALFVREYLYDPSANQKDTSGVDQGLTKQRRANVPGRNFGYNEIPSTPQVWARVFPDVGDAATAVAPPGLALPPGTQWTGTGRAPRANNHIRASSAANNLSTNGEIQYVREVWVQTNIPKFSPAAPFIAIGPDTQAAVPPWTVAVTVRVFARNPRIRSYTAAQLGYDQRKVLAMAVGYFGLVRRLGNE